MTVGDVSDRRDQASDLGTDPSTGPRTAIVTGAAGYLGQRLVRMLLERTRLGVVGLDKAVPAPSICDSSERYEFVKCDLSTDEGAKCIARLRDVFDGSAIFHLAGLFVKDFTLYPHVSAGAYERDNVLATKRVVRAILDLDRKPRLFVLSSTACVYDGARTHPTPVSETAPLFPYAESKLLAEREVEKLRGFVGRVAVLRFSRVLGLGENLVLPRDIVSDLMERIVIADAAHAHCTLGSAREVRGYVHIDSLMAVLLGLLDDPRTGLATGNITSLKPICLSDVAELVASAMVDRGAVRSAPKMRLLSTVTTRVPILNPVANGEFGVADSSSAAVIRHAALQYCDVLREAVRSHPENDPLAAMEQLRTGLPLR